MLLVALARYLTGCAILNPASSHGDYHHSEAVIHRYGTGAMLCWLRQPAARPDLRITQTALTETCRR